MHCNHAWVTVTQREMPRFWRKETKEFCWDCLAVRRKLSSGTTVIQKAI